MACASIADCLNRGSCIDNLCRCDAYFDGDHCQIEFQYEMKESFNGWRYSYVSFFSTMAVAIFVQLVRFYRRDQLYHLKGMTHVCLLITAILRTLSLGTCPIMQITYLPYVLCDVIFGLGFYFLVGAYLIVVTFWIGTYHLKSHLLAKQPQPKRSAWLQVNTRKPFMILAAVYFVIEVTMRVFVGVHFENAQAYAFQVVLHDFIYNAYLGLMLISVSVLLLVYGILTIRALQSVDKTFAATSHSGRKANETKRLTKIVVMVSVTVLLSVIGILLVSIFNVLNTPDGSIIGFSLLHGFELILIGEMMYIARPLPRKSPLSPSFPSKDDSSSSTPSPYGSIKGKPGLINKVPAPVVAVQVANAGDNSPPPGGTLRRSLLEAEMAQIGASTSTEEAEPVP